MQINFFMGLKFLVKLDFFFKEIKMCISHMKILSQILTFSKILFGLIFQGISLTKCSKATKSA